MTVQGQLDSAGEALSLFDTVAFARGWPTSHPDVVDRLRVTIAAADYPEQSADVAVAIAGAGLPDSEKLVAMFRGNATYADPSAVDDAKKAIGEQFDKAGNLLKEGADAAREINNRWLLSLALLAGGAWAVKGILNPGD